MCVIFSIFNTYPFSCQVLDGVRVASLSWTKPPHSESSTHHIPFKDLISALRLQNRYVSYLKPTGYQQEFLWDWCILSRGKMYKAHP